MLCGFSSLWWPFGWNWSYLGFLAIIWRTCGSKCGGEGGGIFPTLCVECCLVALSIGLFFSCNQAALPKWYFLSICPSVTPFRLCSHHCIIMKFLGVITNDHSKVHANSQGQRSKVKVTEVTTQLNRFQTVTPVWIQIWWWNDAYSLMLLRRGALWFFKVIHQISKSHGSKNHRIWPKLAVSGLLLKFEYTNGYEMMHKAWSSIEEVPYCFFKVIHQISRSHDSKNRPIWPNLAVSGL